MPRIVGRQSDGSVLIAYGYAGLVVSGNRIPLHPRLRNVYSILKFGSWEPADEPVPDGLLPEPAASRLMAEFERSWLARHGPEERAQLIADRPRTGDPAP